VTGPSDLRVYVVRHEGDDRYVEAPTMSRAIELWRLHEAILAEVAPEEIGDPDGCDLADELPVIRAAVLTPAAPPPIGDHLLEGLLEFVQLTADAVTEFEKTLREKGATVSADASRNLVKRAEAIAERIEALREGVANQEPPGVGPLAELFDLADRISKFGGIFADMSRRGGSPEAERVAKELTATATALCEQSRGQQRQTVAAPEAGDADG